MAFVEWPPRMYLPEHGPRQYIFPPMPKDAKPLRMGLIGAGGRGVGLARLFAQHPWADTVAIADPLPERQKQALARLAEFGCKPKVYDDYRALLEDDDVQGVIIATPDYMHCENVLASMEAGKHVYCEKPLAITVEDCDEMVRAHAAHPNLVFGVGLCMRYNPLTQTLHELIADGAIGEVKIAYAVDSVAPGGRYYYHGWHRFKKNVCSLLVQKGCHTLDLMSWCIGSVPKKVYAAGGLSVFGGEMPTDLQCPSCDKFDCPERMAGTLHTDYGEVISQKTYCAFGKDIDVGDNSTLIATYANGVKLTYTEIHFTPHYSREFTFVGDKGHLYGNTLDWRIELRRRHGNGRTEVIYPGYRPGGHRGGDPGVVHEFIAAVREGRQPLTGIVEGRWCTVLAITAEKSIESDQVLPVPDLPEEAKQLAGGQPAAARPG